MIRVQELVTAYRQADAQAYIEQHPFTELQYQRAFPFQYQPTLKWSAIQAEFGAKVMAAVVDFNGRAPRYGRNLPSKKEGDIPKIEIARELVETDFNELRDLENAVRQLPAGPSRRDALERIIDWRYGDQVFVRNGVDARLEWIAKQIATKGKYSLTQTNNEQGIRTKVDVDFDVPAGNFLGVTVDWRNPNADIIGDIRRVVKAAKDAKQPVPRFMWCEQETVDSAATNEGFQKFVATYIANALGLQGEPTMDAMNNALRKKGLPVFVVWESEMIQEEKSGAQTQITGWEPGVVTFSVTQTLGNTQYTTSADEYVQAGVASKTKSGIVLIKTWGEEDPITVITKGTAYTTPVLNNSKSTFILSTRAVTT